MASFCDTITSSFYPRLCFSELFAISHPHASMINSFCKLYCFVISARLKKYDIHSKCQLYSTTLLPSNYFTTWVFSQSFRCKASSTLSSALTTYHQHRHRLTRLIFKPMIQTSISFSKVSKFLYIMMYFTLVSYLLSGLPPT